MGPVTIIDPERLGEKIKRNVNIMTYLVQYTRPTGIDCVNTKYQGLIDRKRCPIVPSTFIFNQDNISFISGKFQNRIPITATYVQYIPAFLSYSTKDDLIVFEFKNVLGMPITEAWENGVIPYNKALPITAMVPGAGLQSLSLLSNQLRMVTLIDMGPKELPHVANLLKDNKVNIITIGTVLPDRTLSFSDAMRYHIHPTYKPKRIFYIGSDISRVDQISISGVDIYKYYVNILKTAISVVPEETRNINAAIYQSTK